MFYFLPADMITQILNFGLPAPIDVQVEGADSEANRRFADQLLSQIRQVPGVVDLRIQQPFDQPKLHIAVDRTKAEQAGFTQYDIAGGMLVSLSGSFQTTPTFFLNPKNGVTYNVVTQTPQYRINSLQDLQNVPITSPSGARQEILGDVSTISRGNGMAVVNHYNIHRIIDIFGSVEGRDLGAAGEGHHPHRRRQPEEPAARIDCRHSRPARNHEVVLYRASRRGSASPSCWFIF